MRRVETQAHEMDGLGLEAPLETVAVLRQVLLPVVLHALGAPTSEQEWEARWTAGRFDAGRIQSYLKQWRDHFDLFDATQPFAQVAGLRTEKNETKPVSLLLPAVATGNNVPLFTSRTEAGPPLTPAEAARALLAAHCWDTAAIKSGAVDDPLMSAGKTTGNPTGPLGQLGVVVPMGATLFETLMLNTPIIRQGLERDDRPQWTNAPATPAWNPSGSPKGLLDLLTWQARRIRLVRDDDGLVRSVVLAAGDRLGTVDHHVEPHTAWRRDPKTAAQRPLRHQPGRAAWRGLTSLLATDTAGDGAGESSSLLITQLGALRVQERVPEDLALQVLTVGVAYGNQSAVVEDVMVDLIPLPVAALPLGNAVHDLLLQIVDEAEALRVAMNKLGDDLRQAVGADKLPWDKGTRLGDALVHEFTGPVRRLLGGLQREPDRTDDAEQAWRSTARRLALSAANRAVDALPPTAFLGRELNEKVQLRASTAEAFFRRRLNDVLGRPTPVTTGDRS